MKTQRKPKVKHHLAAQGAVGEMSGKVLACAMHNSVETNLSTREAAVQFLKGAGIVTVNGNLKKRYR